jgi:hypothetical protein
VKPRQAGLGSEANLKKPVQSALERAGADAVRDSRGISDLEISFKLVFWAGPQTLG